MGLITSVSDTAQEELWSGVQHLPVNMWTLSTSGTATASYAIGDDFFNLAPTGSSASGAYGKASMFSGAAWSLIRPFLFSWVLRVNQNPVGAEHHLFIGAATTTGNTIPGAGIHITAAVPSTITIEVHDGTTSTSQSFTVTNIVNTQAQAVHFVLQWNGTDTASLYYGANSSSNGGAIVRANTLIGSVTRTITAAGAGRINFTGYQNGTNNGVPLYRIMAPAMLSQ